MAQRKIIVYIASADGYIARPDGDVEWLNRRPPGADYGMTEFYPAIDTILWGRKTYAWLLAFFKKKGRKRECSTRSSPTMCSPGNHRNGRRQVWNLCPSPVKAFAQRLRATPGKHIWIMGGGGLIASFLDAGEIDEFDIHVIPTLIGEGIPLVAPRHRDVPLRSRSVRKYPDGVIRLRYEVLN
jgi:dihydrofolate reductase